jgi:hypothetical protein
METFTVKKVLELKTAKGDPYKKVDLQKSDGSIVEGVSAFAFKYPNLAELVEGATITAGVVIDGSYKNLVSGAEKPRGGAGSAFKQQVIEKTMEKKEASISKFQDNKEMSIKIASTMRMAVDIATSLTPEQWQHTTMQEEIRFWREWCWTEWDNTGSNTMPPF